MKNQNWDALLTVITLVFTYSEGAFPQFLQQPQNISAYEGSQVSLSCIAQGEPTPNIIWFRNEIRITFPNLNYRLTGKDTNSQTLLIPKVTALIPETTGFFFCIANNKHGSQKSKTAHVTLSSPRQSFKSTLENQAIPRGGHARLHCSAPEGSLDWQRNWIKDGETLQFDRDPRLKLLNDGALLISDIEDSDAGTYKCIVNNGAAQYVNGPALVTVGDAPEVVLDPPSGFNLDRGSKLEVFCLGKGDPLPRVWWQRKDDHKELTSRETPQHAVLNIESAEKEHNGKYICHANNSVGEATIEIEVVVSEPPRFIIEPLASEEVSINESVRIPCKMEGSPTVNVFWEDGDGSIIFSNQESGNKYVDADGTLHITKFQEKDVGKYKCVGDNGHGQLSAQVHIKIKKLPNFPPIFDICPINVNLTSSQLNYWESFCSLVKWQNLDRTEVKFDWLRDGKQIPSRDLRFLMSNNKTGSQMRIFQFKKTGEDDGVYTCRATTDFGQSECSATIKYSPQDRYSLPKAYLPGEPSAPLGIVVNESTVILEWNRPPRNAEDILNPLTYRVEYYFEDLNTWKVAKNGIYDTRTVLTDLLSNRKYFFIVRAENRFGLGQPSKVSEGLYLTQIPQSEDEMTKHQMYNNTALIRKQILAAGVEVQEPLALNSTSVRIAWDVARNTQYITGFYIMHKEKDSAFSKTISHVENSIVRSFLLTKLRPFTDYEISIQAFFTMLHQHAVGKETRTVYVRTLPDLPSEAPRNIRAVLSKNRTSLLVTWQAPPKQYWNAEFLTGYQIWVFTKKMDTIKNHTVDNNTNSVTYQMLPKLDELWFQIAALNQVPGHGLKSEVIKVTIGLGESSAFWTETWFVATVGAILWTILMIVAFWLYRKFQKARYLHYSECETATGLKNNEIAGSIPRLAALQGDADSRMSGAGGSSVHWGTRPCSQCGGHVSQTQIQNCPDLLRQGKPNHAHHHAHHDHNGLATTGFLGGGNMTLPRYTDSSKTSQVVRNNGTSTPPNNCNYNFQYSPTNQQPLQLAQMTSQLSSASVVQPSRGSSGTGSPSDAMHYHHAARSINASHTNIGPANFGWTRQYLLRSQSKIEFDSPNKEPLLQNYYDDPFHQNATAERSAVVSPRRLSHVYETDYHQLGGATDTDNEGTSHPSNDYRHSVYYCCSTSSTNLRNSYAEIPFNANAGSPSGSKGKGASPQPMNSRVVLLSREENPRNFGCPVAILTKPKTSPPPPHPATSPGTNHTHTHTQHAHAHCRSPVSAIKKPATGSPTKLKPASQPANSDSDSANANDSDDNNASGLVPPPPGEPPSSDIESLYEASTLAPSSVYSVHPRDKAAESEYDCQEEDFSNDYDVLRTSPGSVCNKYETAFPRDEELKAATATSPHSPTKPSPQIQNCPQKKKLSSPTSAKPIIKSTSDSTSIPSPQKLNSRRSSQKNESPNSFEPILAPREETKCVPRKVMKPTVSNLTGNSPKTVGTPSSGASEQGLPNGSVHNMEDQCNSCYCVCQQPSDQSTKPVTIKDHSENCYENQYMLDVKAKNNNLLVS